VARRFGALARGAGVAIILNVSSHTWPYIFSANQLQGLVLTKVSRKGVIVLVLQDAQAEVRGVWDVDSVI
jgi:hypothetical protein